jgi:hypothetical protein
MFGIPIESILARYAGSFPIPDDAIFNILERLEETKELPITLAPQAARFTLRTVNALLPELDTAGPEATATVCGQDHIAASGLAGQVVLAQGMWAGETPPRVIRNYLIDITFGMHPEDAAVKYNIGPDEYTHLEFLLELEQHWHDEVLSRVIAARCNGWKWLKTAQELGSWKPWVIRSWAKEARRIEDELRPK